MSSLREYSQEQEWLNREIFLWFFHTTQTCISAVLLLSRTKWLPHKSRKKFFCWYSFIWRHLSGSYIIKIEIIVFSCFYIIYTHTHCMCIHICMYVYMFYRCICFIYIYKIHTHVLTHKNLPQLLIRILEKRPFLQTSDF